MNKIFGLVTTESDAIRRILLNIFSYIIRSTVIAIFRAALKRKREQFWGLYWNLNSIPQQNRTSFFPKIMIIPPTAVWAFSQRHTEELCRDAAATPAVTAVAGHRSRVGEHWAAGPVSWRNRRAVLLGNRAARYMVLSHRTFSALLKARLGSLILVLAFI